MFGLKNDKRIKILLVEDEPTLRKVVAGMFEKIGFEITTVANGREAIDIFDISQFDIILMDLMMPEMDGFEATEYIRKKNSEVPIIALTAHVLKKELDRCLKGRDEWLYNETDRLE